MIKVILKEDLKGQGKKNEVVDVSEGFARNFLLPQGKAVLATEKAINLLEGEKERKNLQADLAEKESKDKKERIEKLKLTITQKAEKGKLFGALSNREIARALRAEGVEISIKQVFFPKPIKEIGEYEIVINLNKSVKASLKIKIEEQK